jgi:protocatechuate 3,4-dioxygenase beta subunit
MRLIFGLTMALVLSGQQQQQQPQQLQAEKPGRVSGKVLNAITGEPVRKATVTLQPAGAQQQQPGLAGGGAFLGGMRGGMSAATDNAGNFVFENVTPGAYRVTGDKTGFIRANFGNRGGGIGSQVQVAAGSDKADVVVRMTPQGIISGRILDEDGEPLEGVNVSVLRPQYFQAQRRFMGQGGNQTNDRGEFRITNVAPGKYYVLVQRMSMGGGPIQQGAEEFGFPKLYFPGVETMDQAQRVEVGPGQEFSGVQMTLRKVRVYRVKGRVAGVEAPADAQAAGRGRRGGGMGMVAQLRPDGMSNDMMGFPGGPPGMGGGQVRADGSFEMAGVTPGAYRLLVNSFAEGRPKVIGNMKINVGNSNVDGIVVTPMPTISFQGKVIVEGDKTLVNLKQVRIQAQSDFGFNQPVQVAEDGTFILKDLSPEKYRITIGQQASAYLKAINLGGQDVKDTGLDLTSGGGGGLEVILSTKIAKVEGMVEKQKQEDAPGTIIVAKVNADSTLQFINLTARVEDSGKFTLANLPPGEYKVFAFEEVETATASDPEFLKKFEDRAGNVKIGEGESKSVTLKQIRYAETTSTSA